MILIYVAMNLRWACSDVLDAPVHLLRVAYLDRQIEHPHHLADQATLRRVHEAGMILLSCRYP